MTLRQRQPRVKDKKYLAYIGELGRDHGCLLCRRPAEVAHVRFADACSYCGGQGMEEFPDSRDYPGLPYHEYRYLPCLCCNGKGYRYGKRSTGAGEKPDDKWTVPLCPEHHRLGPDAQHNSNEREWWAEKGINILALCKELQDAYPSIEKGTAVLERREK